jgi:hypothetical protein
MMALERLSALLGAAVLRDIVVGGYVASDEPVAHFHPWLRSVWLDLGSGTGLMLRAQDSGGHIELDEAAAIGCDFELADDDDLFCTTSLWEQTVNIPYVDYRFVGWVALLEAGTGGRNEDLRLLTLEIRGEGCAASESLTFDPMNIAGFRLLSGDVEARWIEANRVDRTALRRESWRA